LTREEKIKAARKIRDAGQTYAGIAGALGVSTTTVYRWLNPVQTAPYRNGRAIDPERTRRADREYNRRHGSRCDRCGQDRPRQAKGPLCIACIQDEVDRRARRIEREWAAGRSMSEIAKGLGWTVNHLSRELHKLRERGYSLPYRHRLAEPRFPDQVAA
jgi:transposase